MIEYHIGEFLAVVFRREFVFGIQAIGLVLMVLLALSSVVDHSKVIATENQTRSYGRMFIKDLKAVFLSPPSCLFLIANLSGVTNMLLWFQLLQLPPISPLQNRSDAMVGLFFLGINLGGIFAAEISLRMIKKLHSTN